MGRPWIDRVSDPVRRHVMTSLFYAPSLGALAVAGGLAPAALATGMFTAFAVYSYLRIKIEIRDIQNLQQPLSRHVILEHRRSAPLKAQRMCRRLCRDMGIEKPVRVYLYPADDAQAFATAGDEIGFSRKFYALLTPGQLRWVIAHELAHIAKGDTKINHAMLRVSQYMERLAAGIGGAAAMQAMGQPGLLAGGIAGLTAAFAVAKARPYADMYCSRSMERRRDYEATQKAGNPVDAISAIHIVEYLKKTQDLSLRERWLHTHPVGMARFKNIVTAYEDGVLSGVMRPIPPAPDAAP